MRATPDIQLNPAARVQRRRVGHEQQTLIVIDDLLLNPEVLIEAAAQSAFVAPEGTWYPGGNAALPASYLPTLMPVLRPTLERAFGIAGLARLNVTGFFALATLPVEAMQPLQKVPHYDQTDSDCLAFVHYLGRNPAGGTGFFRHRATGYESITADRRDAFRMQVTAELETAELTAFAGPDTPGYEMTDHVDSRFNRLVLYRCNVLHCALFDGALLSPDPRIGRLTANTFCQVI